MANFSDKPLDRCLRTGLSQLIIQWAPPDLTIGELVDKNVTMVEEERAAIKSYFNPEQKVRDL